MYRLIKKDFIAGSLYLMGICIIIPVVTAVIIGASADESLGFFSRLFPAISMMLSVIYSFAYMKIDSANDMDTIFASVPAGRPAVVYARYFTTIFQAVFNFGLVILTAKIIIGLSGITDPVFEMVLSFHGAAGMIAVLILFMSVTLPFVFKFGLSGGFSAFFIMLICIYLGDKAIQTLKGYLGLDLTFIMNFLGDVFGWLNSLQTVYVYLVILAALSVLIFASVCLSVRFYRKRDI
jgi:hypothetical protein